MFPTIRYAETSVALFEAGLHLQCTVFAIYLALEDICRVGDSCAALITAQVLPLRGCATHPESLAR